MLLLSFSLASAQQIDWNKVNSNSIVGLLDSRNLQLNTSESIVQQNGNQNNAMITMNEKSAITVRQNGDYNTTLFDNAGSQKAAQAEITSKGNNNIIDITGTNSLSKEIKINMTADNKTIFIRNY